MEHDSDRPATNEPSKGSVLAKELLAISATETSDGIIPQPETAGQNTPFDKLTDVLARLPGASESILPEVLSNSVIECYKTDPERAKKVLSDLRDQRQAGRIRAEEPDAQFAALNGLIVDLIMLDKADAAALLMSASTKEMKVLEPYVTAKAGDPEGADKLQQAIARISTSNQNDLFMKLVHNGAETHTADDIIQTAWAPDTASKVSQDFWRRMPELPHDAKRAFAEAQGDLSNASRDISAIADHDLGEFATSYVRGMAFFAGRS